MRTLFPPAGKALIVPGRLIDAAESARPVSATAQFGQRISVTSDGIAAISFDERHAITVDPLDNPDMALSATRTVTLENHDVTGLRHTA